MEFVSMWRNMRFGLRLGRADYVQFERLSYWRQIVFLLL